MDTNKKTQTVLARAVAAELRARMAVMRLSGSALAAKAGMSQNYLAKRLRDEMPLTLDDLETIVKVLGTDLTPEAFVLQAMERNADAVRDEYTLAASDADIDSEIEAQQQEP